MFLPCGKMVFFLSLATSPDSPAVLSPPTCSHAVHYLPWPLSAALHHISKLSKRSGSLSLICHSQSSSPLFLSTVPSTSLSRAYIFCSDVLGCGCFLCVFVCLFSEKTESIILHIVHMKTRARSIWHWTVWLMRLFQVYIISGFDWNHPDI